jgi:predicted house-cleaning noncanonical NTP pyrophosphatase (MazG superfamily)
MKKVIFLCNKLGRDKDLENFKAQGIVPQYKMLSGDEWRAELQRKLIEEVAEVSEAKNTAEITDELADILIVISGLCKAHGVSVDELERLKQKKYAQRGGFEHGLYIERLAMESSNPRVAHFRASPGKYPEVEQS